MKNTNVEKKNFSIAKLLLIITVSIVVLFIGAALRKNVVFADSGFDSSYDGGGSSYSGGSDYSYSGSDYYSSSSGSYSGGGGGFSTFVTIVIVIIIIVIALSKQNGNPAINGNV